MGRKLQTCFDRRPFGGILSLVHHHACNVHHANSHDAAQFPHQATRYQNSGLGFHRCIYGVYGFGKARIGRALAHGYRSGSLAELGPCASLRLSVSL